MWFFSISIHHKWNGVHCTAYEYVCMRTNMLETPALKRKSQNRTPLSWHETQQSLLELRKKQLSRYTPVNFERSRRRNHRDITSIPEIGPSPIWNAWEPLIWSRSRSVRACIASVFSDCERRWRPSSIASSGSCPRAVWHVPRVSHDCWNDGHILNTLWKHTQAYEI